MTRRAVRQPGDGEGLMLRLLCGKQGPVPALFGIALAARSQDGLETSAARGGRHFREPVYPAMRGMRAERSSDTRRQGSRQV